MIDKKTYDQFITNGDYVGAANYMSKFHFNDPIRQKVLNQSIKELRTKGRMVQGMLDKADGNQRKAIAFLNSYNSGGNYPGLTLNGAKGVDINSYSQDFTNAKRNFMSSDDAEAESVAINFGGKVDKRYFLGLDFLAKDKVYKNDAFTDMLHISGLSKKALEKSGAIVKSNDGTYNLTISKRNPYFDKVYNALLQLKNDEDVNEKDEKYRFTIRGIDAKGNPIVNKNTKIADSIGNRYDIRPFNENTDKFFDMKRSLDNANSIANEIINPEQNTSDKDLTFSTTTLPFSCAREYDIKKALDEGRIKPEYANALLKETQDAIYNGLINSSFTNYEIWANNIKDADAVTKHKIEDTEEKAKLQELVRNAIGKNNICIASAIQGNQTGTIITIGSQVDNGKDSDPKGNSTDDINQRSVQIFIPNFLNDDAEKLFNKNSKTRAMKEIANMEAYGYNVDIPTSGKLKVYNDYNTGQSVWSMEREDGSVEPLSKEEALGEMNKLIIAEDGIDLANQQFYNEDGELRQAIKDKNGNIDTDFNNQLLKQIQTYSLSAMSELYPDSYKSFAPLADDFINGNTESDDYKTKLAAAYASFTNRDNINFLINKQYLLSNYILNNIGYYDNYNID